MLAAAVHGCRVAQPQLQAVVRPEAAARYGLSIVDVQDVRQTAVGGKVASQIIDGPRRFKVTVRYGLEARKYPLAIGAIAVVPAERQHLLLSRLVRISDVVGTVEISREIGLRRQSVNCKVCGRDSAA